MGAPDFAKAKNKQQQQQLQRVTSDKIREAELVEKDNYIEHLESQLANAHSQLKSLTSPTVTQARSLKVKALTNQVRTLQQELADWESRYNAGSLEQVDDKAQAEYTLRTRVRSLEQDVEAYARNARDLQHQFEQTKLSLNAAESANMELEKRLETFANIVALSPKKDTFNFPPLVDRRGHHRGQSATPRFPTSGMLQSTHSFHAMPPPPTSSNFATQLPLIRSESNLEDASRSQDHAQMTHLATPSHLDVEADYAHSDSASNRDSMLSTTSSRLSWIMSEGLNIDTVGCPSTGKVKPSRKMRRFHASMNPKPLILSTSAMANAMPKTAPPMEQHESPMSFPFPQASEHSEPEPTPFEDSPLLHGRRRAYTDTIRLTEEDLQNLSPLRGRNSEDASSDFTSLQALTSPRADNTDTPRGQDFPSLGLVAGRNLFEELSRAKSGDNTSTTSGDITRPNTASSYSPFNLNAGMNACVSPSQLRQRRLAHHRSISEQTALPLRSHHSKIVAGLPSLLSARNSDTGVPKSSYSHDEDHDDDDVDSAVITVLTDLCRQPYVLARRCLMRGGDRFLLFSSAGGRLQWWLLSFLLGPMVCRQFALSVLQPFLGSSSSSSSSSSNSSASAWRRECRRESKRQMADAAGVVDKDCPCHGAGSREREKHGLLARHNPWLWIKFSMTIAFAIGAAVKDGPGELMMEFAADDNNHYRRRHLGVKGVCTCSESVTLVPTGSEASNDGREEKMMRDIRGGSVVGRNLADEFEV